jgi:hypothetical protein
MDSGLRELVVICAGLLTLASSVGNSTRASEYVARDPFFYRDFGSSGIDYASTHIEEAASDANAENLGDYYCYCTVSVRTYTKAWSGDSAYADSDGDTLWGRSWRWDGPPGTAPGGTLDWVADGGGTVTVHGTTHPVNGNAYSWADAWAAECGSVLNYDSYGGDGEALGSVQDNDLGECDPWVYVTSGDVTNDTDNEQGHYYGAATWRCNEGGSTSVSSGTSLVDFQGGAQCINSSHTIAVGTESGAWADSCSSASADVILYADFF